MTDEDRDIANAALLLDEKIAARLHSALRNHCFREDSALVSLIYSAAYEVVVHMLTAYNDARGGRPLQWDASWTSTPQLPYGYGVHSHTVVTTVGQLPRLV